jgi:hypothetical protein
MALLTRLIFKFINANNNDSFGLGNFNNEEVAGVLTINPFRRLQVD